ncbi:Glutamate receptor 1 [Trichinella pseudospiralis]|uniref:Glutamate receptor 1 n=1 Tax=Trichinella pseudospiralis TaxID=6337 RepID=A0A0V0YN22_TRIPS|nr:Glutamate receptor 1 [Trichinella pseudospiralis]KRY66762.1 Glutamate receptor 1 [Trichinella pseudospiralis]KRZ43190.1 Glutamate receptor 1 [Trichinella pseudospiralis]
MFHVMWILFLLFNYANGSLRVPVGALFRDEIEDGLISVMTYATMENNYQQNPPPFRLETKKGIIRTDSVNNWALTRLGCEVIKDGAFVLMGTANYPSREAFVALSNLLHLPLINWSTAKRESQNGQFELSMAQNTAEAVGDFIRLKMWKNFTYMYDSIDGLYEYELLNNYLKKTGTEVQTQMLYLRNIEPDYFRFFLNFHSSRFASDSYVILHISNRKKLKFILRDLLDAAMKTKNFHYLISGQEVLDSEIEKFKIGLINVSGFQYEGRDKSSFKDFLEKWSRLDSQLLHYHKASTITAEEVLVYDAIQIVIEAFKSIAKVNASALKRYYKKDEFINEDYHGLLCYTFEDKLNPDRPFLPLRHGEIMYEALKKTRLDGISGNVQFDDDGNRINYTLKLTEVLQTGHNAGVVNVQKRLWRQKVGFQNGENHPQKGEKINKNIQPFNRTRIITTIFNEPFVMFKKDADQFTGNDRFEGFCVDLMKLLSEKIENFPYIIKPVKDNQYGAVDQNGRWNGMVGELIRGEADLAIASLTINTLRERVVDFSKPFLTTGISIMIKKPDKQEFSIFSFMQPLSTEVWIFIIIAYGGVSIVIFFIARFSPYEWNYNSNSTYGCTSLSDFTIDNCLWVTLAALMQQGTDIMPRSASCRIASSIWWFFTMIIVSSYTANLAAFLTLEKMHAPIESVEDLARQTKIKYGIQASGSTAQFFKESKVDVHRRMWQYMSTQVPSPLVSTYAEGIQRVRESKGQYAFLLEATTNEYASTRKPCDTIKVGANLNSIGYGVATPFGSDLSEKINLAILELQEIGELKRLEMKWWYEKGQCEQGMSDSQSASLTLSKVAGIFYILTVGIIIAMLVSFVEIFYYLNAEKHSKTPSEPFCIQRAVENYGKVEMLTNSKEITT